MTNPKENRCRYAKIALFVVLTIILIEIAWPAYYIVPRMMYSRKREQIAEMIGGWSKKDAKLASEWESLSHGVLNVCYCSDVVSFQELKKLFAEVAHLDHQPRDGATVERLWDRLIETGYHGKAIVTRFRNYRDALDGNSLIHVEP